MDNFLSVWLAFGCVKCEWQKCFRDYSFQLIINLLTCLFITIGFFKLVDKTVTIVFTGTLNCFHIIIWLSSTFCPFISVRCLFVFLREYSDHFQVRWKICIAYLQNLPRISCIKTKMVEFWPIYSKAQLFTFVETQCIFSVKVCRWRHSCSNFM